MSRMQQSLSFKKELEEKALKEDMRRIKAYDQSIAKILEQVHYIGKLQDEQKNVAEVENIKEKIDRASRKLNDYLSRPENEADESLEAAPSQPQGGGPELDEHPLLPKNVGLPLTPDNMDPEFLEAISENTGITDRAEIQNQIKNKLDKKLKNVNDIKNKLKLEAKSKPAFKPALKHAEKLEYQFRLAIEKLKLKPMVPPPRYVPPAPAPSAPRPRPQGY